MSEQQTNDRCLVTGGLGFIGSHLVDALVSRGKSVRIVDSLATGLESNRNPNAYFPGAVWLSQKRLDDHVLTSDTVYHLAALGSVPRSLRMPFITMKTNVFGTMRLMECMRVFDKKRIIFASSSSVYGGPVPSGVDRYSPAAYDPKSPYAASKVIGETLIRSYAESFGMQAVILRFFNVYGPRQRSDFRPSAIVPTIFRAASDGLPMKIYGDGDQTRDFTYVGDVAEAIVRAGEMQMPDGASHVTMDVCAGQPRSVNDALRIARQIVPGGQIHASYVAARPGDVRDSCGDPTRMQQLLGFVPSTTLEEGLEKTFRGSK